MAIRAMTLLAFILLAACSASPVVYDNDRKVSAEAAIAAFAEDERLAPFFEQAVAYAVFPSPFRGGVGFGGAYGIGWLFEGEEVTGKVRVIQGTVGAQWGGQVYRQILFFRDFQALERFKRGTWEFAGQANATAVVVGAAGTPSFNEEVALFTQVRGGLLLEASIGAHRYDFRAVGD
jgi:lipid-binding SYLF domain-containing protein